MRSLAPVFSDIDFTAERNTERVMAAFRRHSVSEAMFAGTTGYGYDDLGRGALDKIYADIFGAESALVRVQFVNGTHAIASALFACLSPGKVLLGAVGAPYDTLLGVIGISGNRHGSLKSYGIDYREVSPREDGTADFEGIVEAAKATDIGAVLVQRSRGYSGRKTLTVSEINALCAEIRKVNPRAKIVVDNCYGEFVENSEPRGDLVCGSLIKNPGGGLAPAGGYICGKSELVERAAERLTVPGIGSEVGATFGLNRSLFQGLFLAPHTVAQSVKTAVFAAKILADSGFRANPKWDEKRADIIQSIDFGSPEPLVRFCRGIQKGAPVDSFATPEPWPMPGYDCDVIMAAGAFIQGASIELSCDAPMRKPYRAYLQGGLTFESGKLGVMLALDELVGGGL